MYQAVHHIGVAVTDLTAAKTLYGGLLDLKEGPEDLVKDQGVRVKLYFIGGVRIELLEPLTGESAVGKFIAKRGPGLHHIAYKVPNIAKELEKLKADGIRLIDEKPRRGAHGTKIAFIHPSETGGVLTELVEDHPENH